MNEQKGVVLLTPATESLLRDVRAACAGNAAALEYLGEVELALTGRGGVERLDTHAAQAALDAWNAWATQGDAP